MDINLKIKEITEEIKVLQSEVDNKTVRLKLLIKSKKQYEKLNEKAESIDK